MQSDRVMQVEGEYDVGDLIDQLCDRLGINMDHLRFIEITPGTASAYLSLGKYLHKVSLVKGHGPVKYVNPETGDAAMQVVNFNVKTSRSTDGAV